MERGTEGVRCFSWRGAGETTMLMSAYKDKIALARELRMKQTHAEKALWFELRNRKLDGFKFKRQHPIVYSWFGSKLFFFIADFYCSEKSLVIELDGEIHNFKKMEDKQRDDILLAKGLTILRIKNEEIAEMDKVKRKIQMHLTPGPSP